MRNPDTIARTPDGRFDNDSSHPEPTGQLSLALAAPPRDLPKWGAELEAAIVDGVQRWTDAQHDDGRESVDLSEIVDGFDEDAMIEAYGEHRSDWLCSIRMESVVHTDQIRSPDLPTEYRIRRRLCVYSGDIQIGTSRFGDATGDAQVSVLTHCAPAPMADGSQVREEHRFTWSGSTISLLDANGRLQDAEDGTAAMRGFDSCGKLLNISHFLAGNMHSPAPGAPASIEYRDDGSITTERAQHGLVIDGPCGEPSYEIRARDGSTEQIFVGKTGWTRTEKRNHRGNVTSELVQDPHIPGATLLTENDLATGRSQVHRKDEGQVDIDGPNGEPAVEFSRDGRVTSQTWKTRGVWTKTTDYASDGTVAVEFLNRNWPQE